MLYHTNFFASSKLMLKSNTLLLCKLLTWHFTQQIQWIILHLLKQLHWLSINWQIRFKLSTLTFKPLHTGCSKYLTNLLHLHKPTTSMRSPYTQLLALPRHNLSFGSRAFRISAPKNWNTLPLEVWQSHSLSTFRNRLKTLFQISLSVLLATCHQCLEWLEKSLLS